MNSSRKISVIIPTYYRYDCLGDLLDALSRQTLPPDEVIVPDQTPLDDRPAGFYEQFDGRLPFKVMNIAEPSLTAPRNRAAEQAIGDVFLFLDDDTVVGDDLIEPLLGGSIVAKLSRRFGEGLVNGALTARVGVAAIEVCRPLPFAREKRPGVRGIVKRALTGVFGNG